MQLWRGEKVDTAGVMIDPHAHTGLYFVQHGPDGHVFSYMRHGSAASHMSPEDLRHGMVERAAFLHVSGISLAISANACDTVFAAIERARPAGVQVCLDSNLRLRLWPLDRARAVLREAMRMADVFLPSMDDMRHLTGHADPAGTLDWIRDAGADGIIVLKLGRDGAVLDDGRERHFVPGMAVEAVDATGAGDCFAGALWPAARRATIGARPSATPTRLRRCRPAVTARCSRYPRRRRCRRSCATTTLPAKGAGGSTEKRVECRVPYSGATGIPAGRKLQPGL